MEKKWKVCVDRQLKQIKIKGDNSVERPIALVLTPDYDDWMENELWYVRAMEKAKLMAAAPELLEALQEYVWLQEGCISKVSTYPSERLEKAKQAIKKATEF